MKTIRDLSKIGILPSTKLLAVLPHPDDETVFMSGFLNKAIKSGAKIKVLTITKGEKSTLRHGLEKEADLSQVRPKELKDALGILGVHDLEILDIPDGEIEKYKDKVVKAVQHKIKSFNPDFVLTFEPYGIYGHPDHVELSKIVGDIYKKEGNFRLIYSTVDSRFKPSPGALEMAKDPKSICPKKPNIEIRLSFKETLKKIQALRAHKSQIKLDLKSFRKWIKRGILREEYFYVEGKVQGSQFKSSSSKS